VPILIKCISGEAASAGINIFKTEHDDETFAPKTKRDFVNE
jgi:hypothetical protein